MLSRNWSVLAPVPLSAVCFRYVPEGRALSDDQLDELNRQILPKVVRRGRVLLSNATINEPFCVADLRRQSSLHARRSGRGGERGVGGGKGIQSSCNVRTVCFRHHDLGGGRRPFAARFYTLLCWRRSFFRYSDTSRFFGLILRLNALGMWSLIYLLGALQGLFPSIMSTGVPHPRIQLTLLNFVLYSFVFYSILTAWTWVRKPARR